MDTDKDDKIAPRYDPACHAFEAVRELSSQRPDAIKRRSTPPLPQKPAQWPTSQRQVELTAQLTRESILDRATSPTTR